MAIVRPVLVIVKGLCGLAVVLCALVLAALTGSDDFSD